MSRTGLFIALGVGLIAGLLFALFPQLDLTIAGWFYEGSTRQFSFRTLAVAEYARRAAMWISWAFTVPAIIALVIKLIQPRKPLLISGRAIVFLLSTILLTAIVLPNMVFKEYWGRPRPVSTSEFGGSHSFKPWWDPRGDNRHNGSFFSGEAATAFWTYAPAALAPPPVRPIAFAAATLFGLTTGLLRMAFGAHYASDVIAAGLAAFLVTWLIHGLIYRRNGTRLDNDPVDRWITDVLSGHSSAKSLAWLTISLLALAAVRLVALRFSVVDLFPDEARYWVWAQVPAFGYYSKPPLIAWVIAAAGHFCGNSEAGIRAPAPLFYAGTALVTYFVARQLYDDRIGFWAALSIALATGAVFSARIMSTDVLLLFFWALALLAYIKTLDGAGWRWTLVFGLALGFGLLAKYAMIYFFLGVIVLSWLDARARALWRQPRSWTAILIGFAVVSPNLIWNATHHWTTFRHTQGNITGAGFTFNPVGALGFIASQFGVCGPIVFAVFLAVLLRPSHFHLKRADRILLAFAIPPLALVALVALCNTANANWAAPSAISMTVLVTALLVRQKRWRWVQATIVIGVILQILLIVGDAVADRVSLPFLPQPDVYRRTMGWKAMSTAVRQAAIDNEVQSIAAEQNGVVPSLIYYLRDDRWPVLAWTPGNGPADSLELDRPLTPRSPEPILFLSDRASSDRLGQYYQSVETLTPIEVSTGPHSTRRSFVFKLSGFRFSAVAPQRGTSLTSAPTL